MKDEKIKYNSIGTITGRVIIIACLFIFVTSIFKNVIDSNYFLSKLILVLSYIYIGVLVIGLIFLIVNKFVLSKDLPAHSIYGLNSDYIEVHIENKAKGDGLKFFSYPIKTILVAREKKKKVFICTFHVTPSDLQNMLNKEEITYIKPSIGDKVVTLLMKIIFFKKNKDYRKNPVISFIIDPNKLSPETLSKIKKRAQ